MKRLNVRITLDEAKFLNFFLHVFIEILKLELLVNGFERELLFFVHISFSFYPFSNSAYNLKLLNIYFSIY